MNRNANKCGPYGSFFILLIHFNEPHLIKLNIFQRYLSLPHCENHFRRFCGIWLLYLISLIFKVAVTWTARPLDKEKFRVLKIFSTKANLVCILSSVFMLFYLLLHSARAYKMHAFWILHFMMSDCMMMHCLMMQCYIAQCWGE